MGHFCLPDDRQSGLPPSSKHAANVACSIWTGAVPTNSETPRMMKFSVLVRHLDADRRMVPATALIPAAAMALALPADPSSVYYMSTLAMLPIRPRTE